MRTLLVDNYDSFTFNLFHLIAQVNAVEPFVIKNDDPAWDTLDMSDFDNVVISPGPGNPDTPSDLGYSADAIATSGLPVLGVCLGHQAICRLMGGVVTHAPQVMHGRLSPVFHGTTELFSGIPSPFNVVRYHSLIASQLPDCLEGTASTADGILMGLRHKTLPMWGVQFHPESISTEYGEMLLSNFRDLSREWLIANGKQPRATAYPRQSAAGKAPVTAAEPRKVAWRKLDRWVSSHTVFQTFYGDSPAAFWLDSARQIPGMSRFSFMGDASGPLSEVVTYNSNTQTLDVRRGDVSVELHESVFDYVERQQKLFQVFTAGLPFPFELGYVGYFGYEIKAECGGEHSYAAATPDAALIFADRMIAFDHQESTIYVLSLVPNDDWLDETVTALSKLRDPETSYATSSVVESSPVPFDMRHSRSEYIDLIKACQDKIHDGESYEICLTNMIHSEPLQDPLQTYLSLRHHNPAPFAAFLRFDDLRVLSASPERFISINQDGIVEAKPIKGTIKRGNNSVEDELMRLELRNSEKDNAENLMIVDLLRNDLGVVCEVGSVYVPKLFDIESYATVHQLVSTIRGTLRESNSNVSCFRAAFPGGSMTGAPKIRTLDIIDNLEAGPRGIYSGAIGYFSLSGPADWSIVIRTIVSTPAESTIGVGGAITALSDPVAEFEETMLKAKAQLEVLGTRTAQTLAS